VFITHGERTAAEALAMRFREAFGWRCEIPADGATHALS
jgi:hypothetical protein